MRTQTTIKVKDTEDRIVGIKKGEIIFYGIFNPTLAVRTIPCRLITKIYIKGCKVIDGIVMDKVIIRFKEDTDWFYEEIKLMIPRNDVQQVVDILTNNEYEGE